MWIKNTEGKKDAMLTFAVIAFAVVVFNVILATFGTVTIAGATFTFVAMEAGTMAAFLAPTLTAYVTRRWTGAAYPELGKTPLEPKPLPDSAIEPLPEAPPAEPIKPPADFEPGEGM
jgi:hypothetical protein